MAPKIIAATVDPAPASPFPSALFDLPRVSATFDDGTTKVLFTLYPDEIRFTANEFIGKTETEARRLHFEKDRAYLRS